MSSPCPVFPMNTPLARTVFAGSLGLLAGLAAVATAAANDDRPPVSFFRDVRPILQANCQGCHQPAKAEGGYVMTSLAGLIAAGDSGSAGIVPGRPAESYLVSQITPDAAGHAEMPKEGKPLASAEIELITRWIAAGAQDDTPATAGQKIDAAHPPTYTRQPVVTSLDFSPDGRWLAVTGFHEVLLFDLAAPTEAPAAAARRLVGLSERVERVRFSPDGTRLLVTGGNPSRMGEVQIWSVADASLVRSVPVTFDTVYGGCWSPDGQLVAFGCTDNTVRAINATTGEQVLYQGAHEDWVLDTVFSPQGDHVISVGRDMTVKLTELATQRFIDNITSITPGALRGGLAAVDRHPSLEHIVAAGSDGTPRVYRIHRHAKRVIGDDANLIFPLFPLEGRVFDVRFSPDGKRVAAVGGLDGTGRLVVASYELEGDVPQTILDVMAKVPGEPGPRRKGSQRTEADWKTLEDFRTATTKKLAEVTISEAMAYAVAFHPTSGDVAVAGSDGVVRFFDAVTGSPSHQFSVVTIDTSATARRALPLPWPQEPSIEPEQPLAAGTVTALAIEPAAVELAGPFAAVQLVVTGELADGRRVDLTRQVTFEPVRAGSAGGSLVSIGEAGLVRPLADGTGNLRVTFRPQATAAAAAGGVSTTLPVTVTDTAAMPAVDFVRDVNPVLSKMGCNQGTCHGAAKGKNGFKLSLRGYDPLFDVRAFTDDHGSRRVNLASPDDSLMLLKASAAVPHTGGLLARPTDPYYQVVRRWIEQGARLDATTPKVTAIEVFPAAAFVDLPGSRQQFRVVALRADGSRQDVTRQAFLESGNSEVATVDASGLVTAVRRGEAPILVRYEGSYAAVTLTVMGSREGFLWQEPETWGPIDEFVARKWEAMKIAPAPLASDIDFLRRVTLDLTGLPPTADAVRRFAADRRDSRIKRAELVAGLIGSDSFVEHWTNKWADLLQVNPKFLGKEGSEGLRDWIRQQVAGNTPYDAFAREILTASGSNREHPAAAYFKTLRDPLLTMENTTHLFLGVRFNCNKCHDHPFERWTQDQYYETAASFAQVSFARDPESKDRTIGGTAVEGAKPLWEIVGDTAVDEVIHERTGKPVTPKFPYECRYEAPAKATRRQEFAAWLTSADNRYFARSYVNRLWGYLFGAGIIDPIDDIRAGNPPTNPQLLDYLTETFVASGFDTRKILTDICTSRTYGLSITSNRWNEDDRLNYSHALPRRLPAETLFDALHATVGSPSRFPGYPVGTRAAALPDVSSGLGGGFLQTFGRPARESACECERATGMALGPVMALVSGPAVGNVLADTSSDLARLVAAQPDDALLVEEVFLRILNRPSRPEELAAVQKLMAEIQADHGLLVQELAAAEAAWKIEKTHREQARLARVAEVSGNLAAAEAAYAPERLKLEQERATRIAKAIEAVERYHLDPGKTERAFEALAAKGPLWQVARPGSVSSRAGATLTTLADGSVLATGKAGDETTTFTAPVDTATLPRLTGLRLELLPDPSLPMGGVGRAPDGNCVVTEIVLELAPVARPKEVKKVVFHRPQADFSQDNLGVALAIDNDLASASKGWAIAPRQAEPHWAVFEVKEPVSLSEPMVATVKIEQRFRGGKHALGRFRISLTGSDTPLPLGVSARATELAALPAASRSASQQAELTALVLREDPARERMTRELAAATQPLPRKPEIVAIETELAEAQQPVLDDPLLVRLRSDVAASTQQVANGRLTAIQDLAWALINSPAFFFNR
jgi:WD40 repeat protein/mono/diheme cytochrome c family protein